MAVIHIRAGTPNIQKIIDKAKDGDTIEFGKGIHYIENPLYVYNLTLMGEDDRTLVFPTSRQEKPYIEVVD